MADPLLVPMPVEPPAPVEGDVLPLVEPVGPPTEVLLSVVPVVLPALLPVAPVVLPPVVLLLEPTPAEPAPSSRRQRSFSGPAAIRSQRALPRAAVVSVVADDVLPLALGDVVLPLTPEAPVEPLVLPVPELCANAVSENARMAAVLIALNI